MKSVTLVCQRKAPKKSKGVHIPFYGRRRTKAKKIALEGLWDTHFRLERQRREGARKKSTPPAPREEGKIYDATTSSEGSGRARSIGKEPIGMNGIKVPTAKLNGMEGKRLEGTVSKARREKPVSRRGTDLVGTVVQQPPEHNVM
jgi:hypothetical protein